MATDLLIIPDKKTLHLVPVTPHDQELIADLRDDKQYKGHLTWANPRSVKQNRYYWGGVLATTIENQDFYHGTKPLHLWIKTRLGLVNRITFHDDSFFVDVDSTAFDKMPPDEFRTFLDAAIMLICTEIIPGLDPAMLKADASRRTGVSYQEACGGVA